MEEPVWRSEAPNKIKSKLYNFDKRYYFNLKSHRWKRHIDGDWDNGPIISRVPLEPEQAVLSCCSSSGGTAEAQIRLNLVAANCLSTVGEEGNIAPCTGTPNKGALCVGFQPIGNFHIDSSINSS